MPIRNQALIGSTLMKLEACRMVNNGLGSGPGNPDQLQYWQAE